MRERTWKLVGLLGVVVLVLAACSSSTPTAENETDDLLANSKVSSTENAVDETDSTDTPADGDSGESEKPEPERRDPAAPFAVGAVHDPDAELVVLAFQPLDPGTYRTGALGTDMSFVISEGLHVQPNAAGYFVLSDLSSQQPDDRDIVFTRVGNFFDPTAPNAPVEDQALWPNDDFLGWLENLDEGIVASDPVETMVSGLPAITVDLKMREEVECGFYPGLCAGFSGNHGGTGIKAFSHGAEYRVWIVEQADEDPLAIIAGIPRSEDEAWFARADAVLDTIAFGELAPNPVQELEPGLNELRMLGGVAVTLPDNLAELTMGSPHLSKPSAGRSVTILPVGDRPAVIFASDRPHDNGGAPVATADDLIEILTVAGSELTELEATVADGVDVRVFDLTSQDVNSIPFSFSPVDLGDESLGWPTPAAGRIWMIEHPDRGLMIISAHAFENVDETLPVVNELGSAIIDSMTFTDVN